MVTLFLRRSDSFPHIFEDPVHEQTQLGLLLIGHLEVKLLQVLCHRLYLADAGEMVVAAASLQALDVDIELAEFVHKPFQDALFTEGAVSNKI